MIVLEQKLIAETTDSTCSILRHGDKFLGLIIEDGYRKVKEKGKTRIAGGLYDLIPVFANDKANDRIKLLQFAKQQWGHEFILLFNKVVNFNSVFYHWGNFVEDTDACPLINTSAGFNHAKNVWEGGGSRDQYKRFYDHIAPIVKAEEQIKVRISR